MSRVARTGALFIALLLSSWGLGIAEVHSGSDSTKLAEAGQPQELPTSELEIALANGERVAFTIEMALTPEERRVGLMHRSSLAQDRGMLFWYGAPRRVSMWMKNTHIPLDILFIQSDGRIVNIAEETTPFSLESIPSKGRVVAALELNGGTVAKRGIRPGDIVIHDLLASPAD